MIKKLIKLLNSKPAINDWLITERCQETTEAFFVMQNLETTRSTNTFEYVITIYHDFIDNDVKYRGSSSFTLSHIISKKELELIVDETIYAASFVKNEYYEIVQGDKRKVWKEKANTMSILEIINKIAHSFFTPSYPNCRFNSLEIFYETNKIHVINSRNVNLTKVLSKIMVEAIPSFDGENQKVELYKMYKYQTAEFETMKQDAAEALKEVEQRYYATNKFDINKIDVIIKNEDVAAFFWNLIDDYSYNNIYTESTPKRIGDTIQEGAKKDLLNITLTTNSKNDAFDGDGVLLNATEIIKNGKIVNYYGSNRYAYYLKTLPCGNLPTIWAKRGKTSIKNMKALPHLEIFALSGIQIDMYTGYIGGEIRLANYFDGVKSQPISGISFSGNINEALKTLIISKERLNIIGYTGPKYIKLSKMDIL